jgi:acetoin utilization deacetylase AcuC-like enzyme
MSRTTVFYDPLYLEHDTGYGHPERAERLEATLQILRKSGLSEKVQIVAPRDATIEEIQLVHPKGYIEKVKSVAESGGGYLDMDTPVSPKSYQAALRSAGASLEGLERIFAGEIDNAFCLQRPPGHHATATQGMGFCLFNNNAVASRFAMENLGVERVFILDWDAHHGNGIQDIFYDDNKVLYVSLHQYPHYPGSGSYHEVGSGAGEGYTVNFPLPPRSGEDVYLTAFDQVILPIARQYDPQLVLISAGYDGHYSDPLCSMNLSASTYSEMAIRLKGLAEETCGGKMLASLEGGYDLLGIAASMTNTIAVLADEDIRVQEPEGPSMGAPSTGRGMEIVEATKEALSSHWSL